MCNIIHEILDNGVEYYPPINHDAYDEHQNEMYFIGDNYGEEGEDECGCEFTYQDEDIYDSDVNLIFCPMKTSTKMKCILLATITGRTNNEKNY